MKLFAGCNTNAVRLANRDPGGFLIIACHARGQSRRRVDRRFLHDDEATALQVLHKSLGDDRRHHLAGVMDPLAPAVAPREGERICEV